MVWPGLACYDIMRYTMPWYDLRDHLFACAATVLTYDTRVVYRKRHAIDDSKIVIINSYTVNSYY